MAIDLEWKGPFLINPRPPAFSPSEPNLFDLSGLYLLTIEHEGGYLINYVGETGVNFRERPLRAGTAWSYGGRFNDQSKRSREMVDPDQFAQGRRVVTETPTRQEFSYDYSKYQAQLDKIYKSFRYFLAPTFESESIRKSMEAGIIRTLLCSNDEKIRNFLYNINPRKQSPYPLQITMKSSVLFHGLGAAVNC